MLSQAVLASYTKPKEDGIHIGQLTVTGISPCPYETYLHYHHLDDEIPDAAATLRMKNGHWQEEECLEDLRHAGFKIRYTSKNQMILHIGRVPITGRPDGLITVDNREDLLSIKAMSLDRYTDFKQKGLAHEIKIKCQEQLYMASKELRNTIVGCWVYAKHKDSCRPWDIFEEKDLNYSKPIIEATEEIVLGKQVVTSPESPISLCASCRHKMFCWKKGLYDTSGIEIASMPDVVAKWREGHYHYLYGKELVEEARNGWVDENGNSVLGLVEVLGDKDMLLCDDLKVQRIISKRTEISVTKFVEKFGAAALPEVIEEKPVHQIRITEV